MRNNQFGSLRYISKKVAQPKKKKKTRNFADLMSLDIQTLSHPCSDILRPSVVIWDCQSGNRQLVGSVPSGLQRQCNEIGIKTSKIQNIFFTGILDWKSISGLPGMILTVSDQGVKSLGIYHSGSSILHYLVSCWRLFVFRFGLDLNLQEVPSSQPADIKLGSTKYKMTAVALGGGPKMNKPAEAMSSQSLEKLKLLVSNIFPKDIGDGKAPKKPSSEPLPRDVANTGKSTSWVFTVDPVRGKFLVAKAKALGCQVPHFRKLCNFEEVTLDDGTIVRPDQVLSPTRSYKPVLFLDIPSQSYLKEAVNYDWEGQFGKFGVVYHFLGDDVDIESPEYEALIDRFEGKGTIHLIGHRDYTPDKVNFLRSYWMSFKWKSLMEHAFPLPNWITTAKKEIPKALQEKGAIPMESGQVIKLKAGMPCTLENAPEISAECHSEMYDSEIAHVGLDKVLPKETMVKYAKEPLAEVLNEEPVPTKRLEDQVQTIVLGTGSAIPSVYRNVLSNVVRVPYYDTNGEKRFRAVVLDAGEGTMGTIKRIFSAADVEQLMGETSLLYLSHMHADHHMGIAGLVNRWMNTAANKDKVLYIVTPWQYEKFLLEMNQVEHIYDTSRLRYINCNQFNEAAKTVPTPQGIQAAERMFDDMRLNSFKTCYANHCEFAYSCTISFALSPETSKEFLVSYSGDTRPRPAFAEMGHNTDLLIHECTLDDSKYTDALSKKHTTTSEAIQVSVLMNAKKVLLTHFSQRYGLQSNFTDVYKRLQSPDTPISDAVADATSAEPVTDATSAEPTSAEPTISNSLIMQQPVTPEMVANAQRIEVVQAFDNMLLSYDAFGEQREVLEREGERIKQLFPHEADYEEEIKGAEAEKSKKRRHS